jgi:hypothetical protein
MTRQQRRAFERMHADLAKKLNRPPTRRELAVFAEKWAHAQRWDVRLARGLRTAWRAVLAYLNGRVGA